MKKQTNNSSASWWSCPICVNWNKLISSWSVIAIRSRSAYRKEPSWSLEAISDMPCMLFGGKVTPIFMRKWPLNVLADPYVCQFDLPMVVFVTFDWCADKREMIIIWDGIKRVKWKNYLFIWSHHINGCPSYFLYHYHVYRIIQRWDSRSTKIFVRACMSACFHWKGTNPS